LAGLESEVRDSAAVGGAGVADTDADGRPMVGEILDAYRGGGTPLGGEPTLRADCRAVSRPILPESFQLSSAAA